MDPNDMQNALVQVCDYLKVGPGDFDSRVQAALAKMDRMTPHARRRADLQHRTAPVEEAGPDDEPVYVDGPFQRGQNRPKWSLATTPFQRDFLAALKRQYFSPKIKSEVIHIEKSMMSLATGLISDFPTEWVESCLAWAKKKNARAPVIGESELLSLVSNRDKKSDWLRKNREKYERPVNNYSEEKDIEPDRSKYQD
jgi:hypothetical protein